MKLIYHGPHDTDDISRSWIQRSRSDTGTDGHRNLVNSTARKPLNGFQPKLTQTLLIELIRFKVHWVFLLLVMFPLAALQVTPNVAFTVQRMQFLPRLVALPQRREYWGWFLMFTNPSLLMDWRCMCAMPKRVLQSPDFRVNRVSNEAI